MSTTPRPRGVLNLRAGERWFTVSIDAPAPDLAGLVQDFWSVRWDRLGLGPYPQHALAHPTVEVVAERGHSIVVGPTTGRFTCVIDGRSRAFRIRFRPAGFHPLLGSPVADLTDRRVAVSAIFGSAGDELVERLISLDDEQRMVEVAGAFLRSRLPVAHPMIAEVNRIAEEVMADSSVTRVGVGYPAEAAARVVLAWSLPTSTVLLLEPVLGVAVFAGLLAWTMRYAGTEARAAR